MVDVCGAFVDFDYPSLRWRLHSTQSMFGGSTKAILMTSTRLIYVSGSAEGATSSRHPARLTGLHQERK
jgi:hypothetical protein